jgi:hypothetical protein
MYQTWKNNLYTKRYFYLEGMFPTKVKHKNKLLQKHLTSLFSWQQNIMMVTVFFTRDTFHSVTIWPSTIVRDRRHSSVASRQLSTAAAQARSHVSPCGTCCGRSCTGVGLLLVLPVLIPNTASYLLIFLPSKLDRMTANNELKQMCKESVVAWFKILSRHLAEGTKEIHENPSNVESFHTQMQNKHDRHYKFY